MSNDIYTIRKNLAQIASQLRQGKLIPPVQALHTALVLVSRQSLLRNEREEFEHMFRDSVDRLNADPNLRKIYPLSLQYVPGNEKQLAGDLVELSSMLQDESTAEAEAAAKALAAKKQEALDLGQGYLDTKEHDKARGVFNGLVAEYPDDSDLRADIGERVLKAGLYEDAVEHLSIAVEQNPYLLQYYNRLGIALRKLGRYDTAEQYYLKALPLAPEDAYLHFNIGRLYAEWNKWEKALEHGETASSLKPDFEEAKKLSDFSRKKLRGATS